MTTGIAGSRRGKSFLLLWWEHRHRKKRLPNCRAIVSSHSTGNYESEAGGLCRRYRVPSDRSGFLLEQPD
jgi:hypothetical protein